MRMWSLFFQKCKVAAANAKEVVSTSITWLALQKPHHIFTCHLFITIIFHIFMPSVKTIIFHAMYNVYPRVYILLTRKKNRSYLTYHELWIHVITDNKKIVSYTSYIHNPHLVILCISYMPLPPKSYLLSSFLK